MAAQLGRRPSRVERGRDDDEPERPSRVEKVTDPQEKMVSGNQIESVRGVTKNVLKKPLSLNFICMLMVSGVLDFIGLFTSEIPGIGIVLSILYDVIFIPWFYFSGIKFDAKRIGSMGTTSILEYIPFVGNLPLMTLNIFYSYYSK